MKLSLRKAGGRRRFDIVMKPSFQQNDHICEFAEKRDPIQRMLDKENF